jgi:catechol-2,3-dioxygenase
MKLTLDHIVLNVEDAKASANFYHKILESEIERLDKFEIEVVPFPSVRINRETLIDLFPPKMWKNDDEENESAKINLNHFCLNMTEHDWKRLVERLRENNVKITRYADDNWGAQGIGISVYFDDLDGNEIEARYYPSD